jgi:hypothetical protein
MALLIPDRVSSAFALVWPGWTWRSSESSEPALWVTSSVTPTPRRSSWRGWRTRPWAARQFGAICAPSMELRFATWWTSYLQATRASRSPQLERSAARPTLATCGRSALASFARWIPSSSSWRTSEATFTWGSSESSVTLPTSGSMRSGRLFARRTLELPTCGDESSFWPTPTVGDARGAGSRNAPGSAANVGVSLSDMVQTGRSLGRTGPATTPGVAWNRGSSLRLNPEFSTWLMGLPAWWTWPEPTGGTGCKLSATQSYPHKVSTHSASS